MNINDTKLRFILLRGPLGWGIPTAILFQLPLIIYFLTKFNFINSQQLKQYRRHAFVVILILASILTPPDVFSQILIGLPIFILYEFFVFVKRRG